MPIRFCSVMPSMYQRSGMSRFMSASSPGLRSEPINTHPLVALGQIVNHVETGLTHDLFQRAIEFGNELLVDLGLVVPVGVVLGKSDALALHRVADDGGRPVLREWQTAEHAAQRFDVVAVDFDRAKLKARHLSASGSRSWISCVGPADWTLL